MRFRAIPNKMLINTIPNILFSIKAPKILFGKILKTVPYKLESPDGGTYASTVPSNPERLKTQPKNKAKLTAIAVVNK